MSTVGLMQQCSISSALALEILQSCIKPSICVYFLSFQENLFHKILSGTVVGSVEFGKYISFASSIGRQAEALTPSSSFKGY